MVVPIADEIDGEEASQPYALVRKQRQQIVFKDFQYEGHGQDAYEVDQAIEQVKMTGEDYLQPHKPN